MLVTDAQRDSRKAWTYLERLFDWAGTRSKPMPVSDLVIIRDQVTEALGRLVDRADALERAPMLREVLAEDDGTKTVVIDMRDGTTRRFQTRVDWLDTADTLSDPPVSSEVLELRDRLRDQILLTESENALARDCEKQVTGLQERLSTTERDLSDLRERSSALDDALVRDYEQQVSALHERLSTAERDLSVLQELLSSAERDLSDLREQSSAEEERRAGSEGAEAVVEEKIRRLIEERDEWKQRWATASKVIDESLPAIAEILAERTAELEDVRAELEDLRSG